MDELSKLRWQCRRGTKELDFLLNRYLEMEYLTADQRERVLFKELLVMEDDRLLEVLMGKLKVDTMSDLVGKIRMLTASGV
ncbi:MAG: FAD assembly factor SdhE [Methylobacter sp.]